MQEHSDSDLVFYLQVYHDIDLAKWCLANIRRHYPGSRLMLVSDGDPNLEYPVMAESFGAEYHLGKRLYGVTSGGLMVDRMIDLYMRQPAKYLIKFDTDTGMYRRFKYLPDERGVVFGSLGEHIGVNRHWWVLGGCFGFTHEAAALLHQSQILRSDWLKDYANTWAISPMLIQKRVVEMGMISFEFVLSWACAQMGIRAIEFDDVCIRFRIRTPNNDLRYAVIHPCKDGKL